MKIGDLVKYKEPYSKLAYLRKRGMGIITETKKKESRVCFLLNLRGLATYPDLRRNNNKSKVVFGNVILVFNAC